MDSSKKEISCCSAGPKPPRLKLIECTHPTICALAKHTLHRMESSKRKNGSCSIVNMRILGSGIFRCVGAGVDIVREYFYPMTESIADRLIHIGATPPKGGKGQGPSWRGRNSTGGKGKGRRPPPPTTTVGLPPPPQQPYFSWNEASEDKMMLVTNVTNPVYIGQDRTFFCKVSPFYYAQGIVWGISYTNQSMEYVDGHRHDIQFTLMGAGGKMRRSRHLDILLGHNMVSLTITIEEHLDFLTCYAPIWNSTEWGKKTIELEKHVPKAPTVEGPATTHFAWYLNDTKKKLECTFEGTPKPTVLWRKGNRVMWEYIR